MDSNYCGVYPHRPLPFSRPSTPTTFGLPGRQTEALSIGLPPQPTGQVPGELVSREGHLGPREGSRQGLSTLDGILPPLGGGGGSRDSREERASSRVCHAPARQAGGLETRIYQSRPGPATLTHDPKGSGWKGPFLSISPTRCCFSFLSPASCLPSSATWSVKFALNVPRPFPR